MEGVRSKAWVQWSDWGWLGSYIRGIRSSSSSPPHLLHTSFRRRNMRRRGTSGRRSAPRLSLSWGIMEMEESESLENSWLVGRGEGRGKTTDSVVVV